MENKDVYATKFIDSFLKHAIDKMVHTLEEKYNLKLSSSSQLEVLNLSLDYIQRINQTIISQQLTEPDDLDSSSSRFLY